MADRGELERIDRETAERIFRAFQDADRQMRKARRTLRSRTMEAIAEHRERISGAERGRPRAFGGRVDYARLYGILEKQPLTYDIIKDVTGLNDSGVAQVITTLSLEYPVWNPAKGIYELLR